MLEERTRSNEFVHGDLIRKLVQVNWLVSVHLFPFLRRVSYNQLFFFGRRPAKMHQHRYRLPVTVVAAGLLSLAGQATASLYNETTSNHTCQLRKFSLIFYSWDVRMRYSFTATMQKIPSSPAQHRHNPSSQTRVVPRRLEV